MKVIHFEVTSWKNWNGSRRNHPYSACGVAQYSGHLISHYGYKPINLTTNIDDVTCKSCRRTKAFRQAAGLPDPPSRAEVKTPRFIHLASGNDDGKSSCGAVRAAARDFWLVEAPHEVTCVKCKGTRRYRQMTMSSVDFERWDKPRGPRMHMKHKNMGFSICELAYNEKSLTTKGNAVTCLKCLRHPDFMSTARHHDVHNAKAKAALIQAQSATKVAEIITDRHLPYELDLRLFSIPVIASELVPDNTLMLLDTEGNVLGVIKNIGS
jgi:hypothetical protein